MMKISLIHKMLGVTLAGALTLTSAQAAVKDGIIAVVNQQVILQSDMDKEVARIKGLVTDAAPEQLIQRQALDNLINHKLQMDLVSRAGLVTNDEVINQQMLQMARSQGIDSLQALQAKLDAEAPGSYAALRNSIIEEAAVGALWQNQVAGRVRITPQEIDAYLNSPQGAEIKKTGQKIIDEWRTSHILARVDGAQSDAMASQKINALYNEIQRGADFATLAATYSDDTGSAGDHGSLGWVGEGQMVPEFEQVMKNTEAGDYSTPFRSQFGWHILKVDNKRQRDVTTEYQRSLAQEALFKRQAPQAEEDWLQELRSSAYVKIMDGTNKN